MIVFLANPPLSFDLMLLLWFVVVLTLGIAKVYWSKLWYGDRERSQRDKGYGIKDP
jgi:hypothetical protein